VPGQALALLADGGLKLVEKALVAHQPLAGHAFGAALDPLLLVLAAKALQVAELAFCQAHLALEVTQALDRGFSAFSAMSTTGARREERLLAMA